LEQQQHDRNMTRCVVSAGETRERICAEDRAKKSNEAKLVVNKSGSGLAFATENVKKQDAKTTVARKKKLQMH
jgi:hypothetical protein